MANSLSAGEKKSKAVFEKRFTINPLYSKDKMYMKLVARKKEVNINIFRLFSHTKMFKSC